MHTLESAKKTYNLAKTAADLRALALGDLYFFLRHILKRADVEHPWLFARAREVQKSPDGYLDLWSREHYKSTIITFALTIQEILKNPNITIGIFSHTRPIAKAFLRQIKAELETNQVLNDLFFDVLWGVGAKGAARWSEDGGLVVRRKNNPKEATVEAWGLVDGQPTGKHFDLLIYDDVVTRESVTNPEMIKKVTDAWALSLNLGAHGGRRRMIGTRYHFNDTYAEIIERGAAQPRIYAATEDGTMDGEPVFLSPEVLAEKRRDMGPYVFGCQMLQNPKADDAQGFKPEWFRRFYDNNIENVKTNKYILVDPAGEKKKTSDYTVMWVVALASDGNYYVIDGVRDRLNLTERTQKLFDLHRKHQPLAVGYEKYGQQADIEHVQSVMEREFYRFIITPLGGPLAKPDRIKRLVPIFEQGRMWFKGQIPYIDYEGKAHNLTDDFFKEEYCAFPVAAHDDMLDALNRIVESDLGAQFPRENARKSTRAVQKSNLWRR